MEVDQSDVTLPRIAITFCTQCRWMLRAAYFAQELLSTFGTTIGEVALIPGTGGVFKVTLTLPATEDGGNGISPEDGVESQRQVCIWDWKTDRSFPETKILKQLVRNHIDPDKSLGHSDTPAKGKKDTESQLGQENCQTCPPSESSAPVQ